MNALENAGRLAASVYAHSVLYTTPSLCAMCTEAILPYRIPRVAGEIMTFTGEEELRCAMGGSVEVLQSPRCIELMRGRPIRQALKCPVYSASFRDCIRV